MPTSHESTELWATEPAPHDFPAARDYLALQFEPSVAARLADELAKSETLRVYKAKDILRASALESLGRKNVHVRADLDKIAREERLSPVLLVRDVTRHVLIIADGFHRVCASRLTDEDAIIPCRIVTTS
jgi:hypothetical protein